MMVSAARAAVYGGGEQADNDVVSVGSGRGRRRDPERAVFVLVNKWCCH